MTNKTKCTLCGLPFKAAISALPLITGTMAGLLVGCTEEECSPGRRVLHGAVTGGLTAAGTAGLELLAQKVCECPQETCS